MKVESRSQVMLLATTSREYEGKIYYNADLYDLETGATYRCALDQEAFNTLSQASKPSTMKGVLLDVSSQYQGRSRLKLIGWS